MQVVVDVAKVPRFGVTESGDTVEVIERPHGGLSLIMADGQGSGETAKLISRFVVGRAVTLIADGARDGAVAQAVNDALLALRGGKISSTLSILSADLSNKVLGILRNSNTPVIIVENGQVEVFEEPSDLIGSQPMVEPVTHQVEIKKGTSVVAFTDGILYAGKQYDQMWSLSQIIETVKDNCSQPQGLAAALLEKAIVVDKEKPRDDMTVVSLSILPYQGRNKTRTMKASMPF